MYYLTFKFSDVLSPQKGKYYMDPSFEVDVSFENIQSLHFHSTHRLYRLEVRGWKGQILADIMGHMYGDHEKT